MVKASFGRGLRATALAITANLIAFAAFAGSFEVNPVRVDFVGNARSVAVTVRNTGEGAVVIQMSALAWAQVDGKDVLTATDEVLVSPPIATIQPNQEQVVRVGLRRAPDAQRELSYRLFLQEVPPPPQPGFQGLQVALRVGLPIFVQPRAGRSTARLVWDAQLRDDGIINLKLRNNGTGHIQISDIEMFLPSEKNPVASHSSLAYVLPGQAREWDLKVGNASLKKTDRVRLKVTTDAGTIDTQIDLGP